MGRGRETGQEALSHAALHWSGTSGHVHQDHQDCCERWAVLSQSLCVAADDQAVSSFSLPSQKEKISSSQQEEAGQSAWRGRGNIQQETEAEW